MACTCRTALRALRQPTASLARSAVAVPLRAFTSSSVRPAAPAPAAPAAPAASSSTPTSSCASGTVLKGLNYLKDGSDPVAKDDAEYPAWVWILAEEGGVGAATGKKGKGKDVDEALKAEKKDLKRARKVAIKAANSLKG
ncbi:hypothetical protein JCM8097_003050 [Rhodosporidiobolus ruineniae]